MWRTMALSGPAVARIPAALTIHDLQPLLLPENFSAVKRRWIGPR